MANDALGGEPPIGSDAPGDVRRRDFLDLVAWSMAAAGGASIAWPFIAQMNPSADVLALSTTDVDLGPIPEGQAITVVWQGKPVFVRRRTAAEIKAAEDVPLSALRDPQADRDRVKPGKDVWLVVIGICTHLGCVPGGNKSTENRGPYGGWFCPCHGSAYDTSGRIRQGPAPLNLALPPYAFRSDTSIRIG